MGSRRDRPDPSAGLLRELAASMPSNSRLHEEENGDEELQIENPHCPEDRWLVFTRLERGWFHFQWTLDGWSDDVELETETAEGKSIWQILSSALVLDKLYVETPERKNRSYIVIDGRRLMPIYCFLRRRIPVGTVRHRSLTQPRDKEDVAGSGR